MSPNLSSVLSFIQPCFRTSTSAPTCFLTCSYSPSSPKLFPTLCPSWSPGGLQSLRPQQHHGGHFCEERSFLGLSRRGTTLG